MINEDEEVQWAYLLDPTFELINSAGKPLTDGWIEVYIHGTRSKYYCASDFNGTLHPFKIPLDSLGANIVLASPAHAYDVYVYNKFGSLIMSRYNVVPATGDGAVIEDVVTITSEDGTVAVTTTDQTNWDLSIKDTVDQVAENTSDIGDIKDDIDDINDAIGDINDSLANKKDKQTAKSFDGAATKTVKKITQNANGEITVEYEDIDLPPEVPNVEVTSEDNSIQVTESTDAQTNTKTFDLSVNVDDPLEYGQFRATNVSTRATLNKIKGNLNLNNNAIALKKGNSYHFTLRGTYVPGTASNTYANLTYIEYSAFQAINVNVDNTITDGQCFEISYDVYNLNSDLNYIVSFAGSTSGTVSELWVEVHNLNGVSINGSGGGTYTAGDAIDITNDTINVKVNPTSGIDIVDDKLVVKVGEGLSIDPASGLVVINSEVSDVVETVEKMKEDLDTQLTVNFDMPNIDNVYDFADESVIGMSNGAIMLCQAFTVPINHEIRVDDGVETAPTLLGIYAKQAFAGQKIMLALYVYDFSTGYTDYVGDTGPVEVTQGRNEFPLKHINTNQAELKSSCVYYASLYLPSNAHSNGLYLAGCPSYSNASYINATPRFTVGVQNITYNGSEIDMTDDTTGRLDYNDGNGNYYIGPWSDGYNERPSIPRFFMQIRNGEIDTPIVIEPFTNIDYQYIYSNDSAVANDIFDVSNLGSAIYPVVYQEVTPNTDINIVSWTVYDGNATDSNGFYKNVYSSSFDTLISSAGTITDTTESYGYSHTVTLDSPLQLTAGTTYRFPVAIGDHDFLFALRTYDSTVTATKVLHLFASGWNVSNWVNYSRVNAGPAVALTLTDSNNNTWNI